MSERKIDIYNHVMPRAVADRMRELAPSKGDMVKRVTNIPMLYDIEARIRMMGLSAGTDPLQPTDRDDSRSG
jgi:hypothetical protein